MIESCNSSVGLGRGLSDFASEHVDFGDSQGSELVSLDDEEFVGKFSKWLRDDFMIGLGFVIVMHCNCNVLLSRVGFGSDVIFTLTGFFKTHSFAKQFSEGLLTFTEVADGQIRLLTTI